VNVGGHSQSDDEGANEGKEGDAEKRRAISSSSELFFSLATILAGHAAGVT